jgi:hypothetical protein
MRWLYSLNSDVLLFGTILKVYNIKNKKSSQIIFAVVLWFRSYDNNTHTFINRFVLIAQLIDLRKSKPELDEFFGRYNHTNQNTREQIDKNQIDKTPRNAYYISLFICFSHNGTICF